jgi:uncharacterized protein YidB (DUF937 family)
LSSGFEQILSGILGGGGGGGQGGGGKGAAMAGMAAVAAPMVLKFLQGGGLDKLLGNMQSKGMEDKAQSWVSKGENRAITPQELEQVVPKEQIDQLAQQTGATPEQAEEVLAQALPQVVDKVTPDGQLPQQAQLDDMLGQLFGQKQ